MAGRERERERESAASLKRKVRAGIVRRPETHEKCTSNYRRSRPFDNTANTTFITRMPTSANNKRNVCVPSSSSSSSPSPDFSLFYSIRMPRHLRNVLFHNTVVVSVKKRKERKKKKKNKRIFLLFTRLKITSIPFLIVIATFPPITSSSFFSNHFLSGILYYVSH